MQLVIICFLINSIFTTMGVGGFEPWTSLLETPEVPVELQGLGCNYP